MRTPARRSCSMTLRALGRIGSLSPARRRQAKPSTRSARLALSSFASAMAARRSGGSSRRPPSDVHSCVQRARISVELPFAATNCSLSRSWTVTMTRSASERSCFSRSGCSFLSPFASMPNRAAHARSAVSVAEPSSETCPAWPVISASLHKEAISSNLSTRGSGPPTPLGVSTGEPS